jgi:hypothetical protein
MVAVELPKLQVAVRWEPSMGDLCVAITHAKQQGRAFAPTLMCSLSYACTMPANQG